MKKTQCQEMIPAKYLPICPKPFTQLYTYRSIPKVTKLFHERLQAYKHACGYLEDYITQTEKMQTSHSKDYDKALKAVSNPLKESNHFDQNLGGVAEMFDNIRSVSAASSRSA